MSIIIMDYHIPLPEPVNEICAAGIGYVGGGYVVRTVLGLPTTAIDIDLVPYPGKTEIIEKLLASNAWIPNFEKEPSIDAGRKFYKPMNNPIDLCTCMDYTKFDVNIARMMYIENTVRIDSTAILGILNGVVYRNRQPTDTELRHSNRIAKYRHILQAFYSQKAISGLTSPF